MSESTQNINNDSNTDRLKLIYEDSTKSVDVLRETLNQLSTRLSLLLGFEAAFTGLSLNLPSNNLCTFILKTETYFRCNMCLILKVLAIIALFTSTLTTLLAIFPKSKSVIIDPTNLLTKTQSLSIDQLREEIIHLRSLKVKEFQEEIAYRARRLKWSLILLGSAALVAALDILLGTLFQLGLCKA